MSVFPLQFKEIPQQNPRFPKQLRDLLILSLSHWPIEACLSGYLRHDMCHFFQMFRQKPLILLQLTVPKVIPAVLWIVVVHCLRLYILSFKQICQISERFRISQKFLSSIFRYDRNLIIIPDLCLSPHDTPPQFNLSLSIYVGDVRIIHRYYESLDFHSIDSHAARQVAGYA